MRLKLCVAACAALLAVAGCGGSDSDSSSTSATVTASTTARRPLELYHYVNRLPRPQNPGPHPGARIDHLIVRDIRKGVGQPIRAGDRGQFDFIATNWVTGRPLEAAWRKRRQFEIKIEHNEAIDGWWQAIPGMRVGGRRQIIIPPALGFTTHPNPEIKAATTYFDVVLVQIDPQRPAGLSGGEDERQFVPAG